MDRGSRRVGGRLCEIAFELATTRPACTGFHCAAQVWEDSVVARSMLEGEYIRQPKQEGQMSKVRVLVGTRKGAFILTSDGKRENWDVSGPHFAGWEIYHVKGSPADPNRLYASQSSGWFGQVLQCSDDGGKTWHQPGMPIGQPDAAPDGPPKSESNKFVYDASPETGKALTTHQWYDGTQHP